MKTVALIIAGGKGQRFWPKSRESLPKQFLSLDKSENTLIQLTVNRILPLVDMDDIFVITGKQYHSLTKKQLPKLPSSNILIEPSGRNTAPAINLAVEYIKRKYDDCVMYVLPCDHMILNECKYIEMLKTACEFVTRNNALVTIGVVPSFPNTEYGYIKANKQVEESNIHKVSKFVEKPDIEKAKEYLASGSYFWNAGMFIWKLSDIDEAFKKYMPKQYDDLNAIFAQKHVKTAIFEEKFNSLESISIDYGIMEKADNIYVVTGEFGWDDVGSWNALERINAKDEQGNVVVGENVNLLNTKNTIICNNSKKLIATVGVDDLVIVNTDDVVLVAKKDQVKNVKEIITQLKEQNKDKFI